MPDITDIIKKQAAWQQGRSRLPWAVKLKQSIILRQTGKSLHKVVRETEGKYAVRPSADEHLQR